MVATVLKIRFRILGNTLARSTWQLVGFVVGAVAAAGVIVLVAAGLVAIGITGLEAASAVITMGGALLVLGWAVAPLLVGGVDTTIDAERLAPFPMSTRQVMVALTAVGIAGIPGLATAAGVLSALGAWVHWPAAFAAALLCLPLGLATCIITSRTVSSFSSRTGRGLSNLIGLFAFTVLVLAGPILSGLIGLVGDSGDDFVGRASAVIQAISWTPVGAVWAVPGEVAAGHALEALVKFAVAAATLVALWLLWRRNVQTAASAPRRRVVAGRAGRLGLFGLMPTGGVGATWARALRYWLSDPRYTRNLVIVAVLPALLAFALRGRIDTPLFAFAGVIPALLLGLVPYADVAFDGTAFASVLATGIRGRADRAGRLLAAATAGIPVIVAVAVVTVGLSRQWMLLPGILGTCLAALLIGLGVCALSSAYVVIPVPASGDNIFKRVPGATFVTGLALLALTLLAGVLTAPTLVVAIFAATGGGAPVSWAAFAVGLTSGAVVAAAAGVLLGGRAFDRTAPTLLVRIQATRGL